MYTDAEETRARAGCEVQGLIGASPRVHETGAWSCGDPLKTTIAVDGVGLVPLVARIMVLAQNLNAQAQDAFQGLGVGGFADFIDNVVKWACNYSASLIDEANIRFQKQHVHLPSLPLPT